MNLNNILSLISNEDPEKLERLSERRDVLKSFSSKIAALAVPVAVTSLYNKAYGKNTGLLYDILTFALSLKYLKAAFYKKATEDISFIPSEYQPSVQKLAEDEAAHVNFLIKTLEDTKSAVPPPFEYDFTAGYGKGNGVFPNVFTNFATFLTVAQLLEDLGVRGFKGQIPLLSVHNDLLQAMVRIHSVEARHAAHIRYIRRKSNVGMKPWITGNKSEIGYTFGQNIYKSDERTTQYNTSLVNFRGYDLPADRVSEAFDEPLIKEDVQKIIESFIVA